MKIRVSGKNIDYQLSIYYHYKFTGGFTQKQFLSYDDFVEFMDECHPDIDYHEVGSRYSKLLEMLNKLAGKGKVDEKYLSNNIHCFISGDSLVVSTDGIGIMEKMYEHFSMSDKVNEGYLHTFLANNWSFDGQPGGYFKINYWYNKDSDKAVYKVHCFKNKVVFEQSNGMIHSMIVCDKYYVHYEGLQK
jgi:hypothetical protein